MYETSIALKTIRTEGYPAFFRKLGHYLKEFFKAFFVRIPRNASVEVLADYLCDHSRLISACQDKEEFIQLAKIVKQMNPRYVLEIGTARGGSLAMWCACSHAIATLVSMINPKAYPWRWLSLLEMASLPVPPA